MKYDYLIVGAGFSGCVLAERLASQRDRRVLIVEKRNHIGGNACDYYNESGILVHKYGPHYFRTNNQAVWDYLSRFTPWHPVQYRILAFVDGQLVPFPINLDTVNGLFGTRYDSAGLDKYFKQIRSRKKQVKNSEDVIVSQVGRDLYEKFFKNYTKKQWDLWPGELDPSVCKRIPVRTNRDPRYFGDVYQAMPKFGYSWLFRRMTDHPNIQVLLQTDYRDVLDDLRFDHLIYTGPIDLFFDGMYGELPYRSLRFEHETRDVEFVQPVSQVNYPNDYDFTRIVEIKHVTGQRHPQTTLVREYPTAEGEPYYPIPKAENEALYRKYHREAKKLKQVSFIGRLAQYRYLNMDQVVANSLQLFETLSS